MKRIPQDPIEAYYLLTPLFAVADLAFDASVRVAGLQGTGQRFAYYAAVFALGLLCRVRPRATPFVGMVESSVNLLLLLAAILLPIWSLPDAVLAGGGHPVGLSGAALANTLLSGTALVLSFHRSRAAAAAALGGTAAGRLLR